MTFIKFLSSNLLIRNNSVENCVRAHSTKTWKLIGKYGCVWCLGAKAKRWMARERSFTPNNLLFGNTFNCISHCIQFSINIAHSEPNRTPLNLHLTHKMCVICSIAQPKYMHPAFCCGVYGDATTWIANRVNIILWIFMPNVWQLLLPLLLLYRISNKLWKNKRSKKFFALICIELAIAIAAINE